MVEVLNPPTRGGEDGEEGEEAHRDCREDDMVEWVADDLGGEADPWEGALACAHTHAMNTLHGEKRAAMQCRVLREVCGHSPVPTR